MATFLKTNVLPYRAKELRGGIAEESYNHTVFSCK